MYRILGSLRKLLFSNTSFIHKSNCFAKLSVVYEVTRVPAVSFSDGRNCCDLLNRIPVPEQCRTVIRVPENDPVYTKYGQKCIRFNRAVTSAAAGCPTIPTNFVSILSNYQVRGVPIGECRIGYYPGALKALFRACCVLIYLLICSLEKRPENIFYVDYCSFCIILLILKIISQKYFYYSKIVLTLHF